MERENPRTTKRAKPAPFETLVPSPLPLALAALLVLLAAGPIAAQVSDAPRSSPNRSDIEVGGARRDDAPAARPRPAERAVPAANGVPPQPAEAPELIPPAPPGFDLDRMTSPEGLNSTLRLMLVLTVLSLAPSILIMTTCFIRFVIVFGLLRQALGTQQLPPNQVLISLCLFLTFFVMAPVWQRSYEEGVQPYTQNRPISGQLPNEDRLTAAARNTLRPVREFMADQIERTGNSDGVWMLVELQRPAEGTRAAEKYVEPENYDDVPLSVLLPAYMLSELKTSFVIGFQIYLPFLVIDMVVSSILTSMGMMMLPPVLISNPLKLLLFVLIDGWMLTVGMLIESVRMASG